MGARMVEIARFDLAPIRRQPWRDATRVPARLTLSPLATQRLGAIAEGRITRVHVLPGDVVRRGQVLVRIHSHEMMDARAKLAQARIMRQQAEADLALATSQAERAERLHAARALALADLERARTLKLDAIAKRDAAQAELDRAKGMEEHLLGDGPLPADYDEHDVLIRSPIDGLVVTRDAQEGVVVTVGMPLVTVSRTSELWMQVHVPETAAAVARVGTQIRFSVAALGGRSFDARVVRVAPAVDTLTRTVEVQAVVQSKDPALKPELFATAELGGVPGAPTWVVPAGAIQAIEGDTVVIAADRRGEGLKLEAVRVRVGRRTSEWVELLAGMDTTRSVVVGGAAIAKAEILKHRGG
jgi:cobalt-zinc-cadmium efflux system membrane fusion protein